VHSRGCAVSPAVAGASTGVHLSSGAGSRLNPSVPPLPRHVLEELALKDRALEEAFDGITISDARLPDNPLIYVNSGFERLTGYSRGDVLGQNCRFLQGPTVSQAELEKIRVALRDQTPCTVLLQNFRKDGSLFWNRLSITPVRDPSGVVTHFIGVQSDVTEEQNAREALRSANRELRSANDRLRRDLEAAARVQRWFLPSLLPETPGARLGSLFRPCTELAGDMFNAVRLGEDLVGLYVLDVSGHGVASSLLSVTVSHMLSAGVDPDGGGKDASILSEPGRALELLNRQFRTAPETAQYFTIVCALYDGASRMLRYASAGHWEPILVPGEGVARRLDSGGLPVGLFPDAEYSEASIQLEPGDRVYLYTDGILDAENRAGEHFGMQRLLDCLGRIRDRSLEAGLEAIPAELEQWTGSADLQDDISALGLEVKG
jgi:phosphoserine phosphatase RsbU/P